MPGPADPFSGRTHGHRGRLVTWEGHELLELESPHLRVVVSLSRGGEILEIRDKSSDVDILWHGHEEVRRNVHAPATIELPHGSFLDHFAGGWQVVFPNAQYPTTIGGAPFGVHGELALLPWRLDSLAEEDSAVWVQISVESRRLPVRMSRRLTVESGRLIMSDRVENLSAESFDVQWGHHLALGGPIADPGTTIRLPQHTLFDVPDDPSPSYRYAAGSYTWPRVSTRRGGTEEVDRLPPSDGTDGHVIAGPMNEGWAEVISPAAALRLLLEWDARLFPYCWIWNVLGGMHGWPLWGQHRLFTLEPFTTPLESRDAAVDAGRALTLGPGEARETQITLTVSPIAAQETKVEDES
jgi:galactose mutarotase-like enzyme